MEKGPVMKIESIKSKDLFEDKYQHLSSANVELYEELKAKYDELVRAFDEKYPDLKELSEDTYNKVLATEVMLSLENYLLEIQNKELKEDLQHADEVLNEAQEMYESEVEDNWQNQEWFHAELEKEIEKWKKASIDPVTELKRREGLYLEMIEEIETWLKDMKKIDPKVSMKDMDEKAFIGIIEGLSEEELAKIDSKGKSNVMMGDLSFLSLANEDGHKAGDELLKDVGKIVSSVILKAYRHGGDEFTALLEQEKIKAGIVERTQEKIKGSRGVGIMKLFKLEPNMDIGVAKFSEAVKVFQSLMKDQRGRNYIPNNKQPQKELQDVWLDIADKRAFIDKAVVRIKLLCVLRKECPDDYQNVISYLRKGGYNIADEKVDEINKEAEAGFKKTMNDSEKELSEDEKNKIKVDFIEKLTYKYIKEKEESALAKAKKGQEDENVKSQYDVLRNDLIYKIAKKDYQLLNN